MKSGVLLIKSPLPPLQKGENDLSPTGSYVPEQAAGDRASLFEGNFSGINRWQRGVFFGQFQNFFFILLTIRRISRAIV